MELDDDTDFASATEFLVESSDMFSFDPINYSVSPSLQAPEPPAASNNNHAPDAAL